MLTDHTALVIAKAGLDLTHPWFRAYLQGATPRAIAAEHNAHPNAVHNVLRRYLRIAPQLKFLHDSLQAPDARLRFAVTAVWKAHYDAAARHHAATGHLPLTNDSNPAARAIGRWLSKQRALEGKQLLGEDQLALLAHLPDWQISADHARRRKYEQQQVHALRSFRDVHGRWPSQSAGNPDERALGLWLYRRRRSHRIGALKAGLQQLLDERCSGWDTP